MPTARRYGRSCVSALNAEYLKFALKCSKGCEELSTGQQAVDVYLVLCADINMPVHDHRDVEA
jgi:hypothetical protein